MKDCRMRTALTKSEHDRTRVSTHLLSTVDAQTTVTIPPQNTDSHVTMQLAWASIRTTCFGEDRRRLAADPCDSRGARTLSLYRGSDHGPCYESPKTGARAKLHPRVAVAATVRRKMHASVKDPGKDSGGSVFNVPSDDDAGWRRH